MIDKIQNFFHNRRVVLLGAHRFEKLKTNPIPVLILVGLFAWGVWESIPYLAWASKTAEEFVLILDLQKILKLNFLENKDFYRFPVLFVWFYLVVSFLFDLSNLWKKELETSFFITDDALFLKKGSELQKFPFPPNEWKYKGGFFREWLGLCKLEFVYNSNKIESPYFFGRFHESLLTRIKRS